MDYKQLKQTYKNLGDLGRKDLAENFQTHYDTEIMAFADEAKLNLGQALNLYSPEPTSDKRPADAVLDCIAYRGLRTKSQDGIAASPVGDFFEKGEENFALGIAYLQNVFSNVLDQGIDDTTDYSKGYPVPADNAPNPRANLPRPFNPQQTGSLEVTRNYRPRVGISDIISSRRTIVGDQYEAPIVEVPTDTKIRAVGEDTALPRYKLVMDDKITRTREVGYELELTDKLRRSTRLTMEAVARVQMFKAMQVENAIVDHFLQMIGTDATAHAMADPITSADVIKLHMVLDDMYMFTTMIGVIDAVVKYANADIFFTSTQAIPGTQAQRNFVDIMLGNEFIAKKKTEDVPVLVDAGSKPKMMAFDRRHTLDYIVEQRGTVQETYRENAQRTTIIANCHNFAGHLIAESKNCRYMITIG